MNKVIEFPVRQNQSQHEVVASIREQLKEMGASEEMATVISNRMSNFIKLASFSIRMEFTVSNELQNEFDTQIRPEMEKVQAKLKECMHELMFERLMFELELYQLETKS